MPSAATDQLLPRPTAQFRRRAWHDFQRALDPLGPPRPLPQVPDETVRVLVWRQAPEVDAVQPVELLEVEDRRARADPVEREALHELVAGHHRRLVVVAPAEQGEEVDERLGDVALSAEL